MADMNLYDVTFGDYTTQIKLSDDDAEAYGDRAKKVGSVKPAEAQPVGSSSHGKDDEESGEKQAEAPKNKARSASSK